MIRQYFIANPYPPSTSPIEQLQQINISDLRLETHHSGKVLFVRTFGHPRHFQTIENAVEDGKGGVDRLEVYFEDLCLKPDDLLPRDRVFAIKEPFYKATNDGGYAIRVDHPSNLVPLQSTDQRIPPALTPRSVELDKEASAWKQDGNAAYGTKDYRMAVELYTRGISACAIDEALLKYHLLRNRALMNHHLSRYEAAAADAAASIIPPGHPGNSNTVQNNVKAWYRAGCAAYQLGLFDQSAANFRKGLELKPDDKETVREAARTADRLKEESSGVYDIPGMSKSASKQHNRLDHASYTRNTEVRDAGKRGRGLFATKDIKAGDLILCEKAFDVARDSENAAGTVVVLNLDTNRAQYGPHASLLFNIVQKLRNNPSQALRFLSLHDGGYTPKCTAPIVDRMTVIDTFQAADIIEHNVFGCPIVRSVDVQRMADPDSCSVGIWIQASYINHACDANAQRSFIGDMMIVQANKEISKGEEIFMTYQEPAPNNADVIVELEKTWGFTCDCTVCAAESATPSSQRKHRKEVIVEVGEFLSVHHFTEVAEPDKKTVAAAEKLYARLESAYDKKIFQNVPRLGLAQLGLWLCQACEFSKQPRKTIDAAIDTLQKLGFGVVVEKGKVRFDRKHSMLTEVAVDAAVFAAHAYASQGDVGIGMQFEDFAKQQYRIMFGELRGFVEKFGL